MSYVDGYVLPVPKRSLRAYKRMAKLGRNDLDEAWRARLQGVRRRRPRLQVGHAVHAR